MVERKKPKILQPGDPGYESLVGSVTDEDVRTLRDTIHQQVSGKDLIIPFQTVSLRQGTLEYGVIETSPSTSKLIFHFQNVSRKFANDLGRYFWEKVRRNIITDVDIHDGTIMEVGENPVYRNNWDVTILNVSTLMASAKMSLILKGLRKEFSP